MNKAYLKTILENIDKEFPNSAMIYGLDSKEDNPAYVFVLLDDNNMYFGTQTSGTDKVTMKCIDIDKISKVSFVDEVLSIQVKDDIFDFIINTEVDALRALCKEFKLIKTKEAKNHKGSVMNHDFEERQLPKNQFSGLRTDISPYGIQNKPASLLSTGEHKVIFNSLAPSKEDVHAPINKVELPKESLEETKVFSTEELLSYNKPRVEESHDTSKDDITDAMLGNLFGNDSGADKPSSSFIDAAQPLFEKAQEEHDAKVQVSRDITMSNPVAPKVIKESKPLSKKELKKLQKEEDELYGKKRGVFSKVLLTLLLLTLTYFIAGVLLAELNIIELPFYNLPIDGVNFVRTYIQNL